MPKTPCEQSLYLVDQLAMKARRISDAVSRIGELIAADGNIPMAQKSAELQSIRFEMEMLAEDWQRTYSDLETHKHTHQC